MLAVFWFVSNVNSQTGKTNSSLEFLESLQEGSHTFCHQFIACQENSGHFYSLFRQKRVNLSHQFSNYYSFNAYHEKILLARKKEVTTIFNEAIYSFP